MHWEHLHSMLTVEDSATGAIDATAAGDIFDNFDGAQLMV